MKTKIPISQLTAWLLVATGAPILSLSGNVRWTGIAIGAIICAGVGICVLLSRTEVPKWVDAIELLYAVVYLGAIAQESATCWQDGINTSLLPAVLLIVAALGVSRGMEQGGRCGASLLWFVVPGVCIILLAGVHELKVPSFEMKSDTDALVFAPVFLLPVLARRIAREESGKLYSSCLLICGVATAATLWLSSAQIADVPNAFYEYSKGVTLFGVAERFEAVSACLLTAGWFALFAFLLGVMYEMIEQHRKGFGRWGIWISVSAAILIMYNLPIPLTQLGILGLISWGVLPLLTQAIVGLKKSKKTGKSA